MAYSLHCNKTIESLLLYWYMEHGLYTLTLCPLFTYHTDMYMCPIFTYHIDICTCVPYSLTI